MPKGVRLCHPPNPTREAVYTGRLRAGLTQFQAAAMLYRTTVWWQEIEYGNIRMDPILWEYWQLLISEMKDEERYLHEAIEEVAGRKNLYGYEVVD